VPTCRRVFGYLSLGHRSVVRLLLCEPLFVVARFRVAVCADLVDPFAVALFGLADLFSDPFAARVGLIVVVLVVFVVMIVAFVALVVVLAALVVVNQHALCATLILARPPQPDLDYSPLEVVDPQPVAESLAAWRCLA
jgi:hypothetical protein